MIQLKKTDIKQPKQDRQELRKENKKKTRRIK